MAENQAVWLAVIIFQWTILTKTYTSSQLPERDTLEWEGELSPFLLSTHAEVNLYHGHKIVVDSWNNIKKYKDVHGAFFIFDEQSYWFWDLGKSVF